MSGAQPVWVGDFGWYSIGAEWLGVRIRKGGWPDQRFRRGKEMVSHFSAIDKAEGRRFLENNS